MTLRTALLAGAVTLVGLGGFLLLQTTSVSEDGVSVGKVPTAAAQCQGEPDCRPSLGRLRAVDGTELDDTALAGKVVMVNFWAPWCGPCVEEMPALQAVYHRHAAEGFVIVGIALDEPSDQEALAFLRRSGVSYPNVRTTRAIESALGRPAAIPTSIIYDRSGHQVAKFARGITERQLEAQIAPLLR